MKEGKYYNPYGYFGIGSDIKWCNRITGSKFCLYCRHRASFGEWSNKWNWHYLLRWNDDYDRWYNYAHESWKFSFKGVLTNFRPKLYSNSPSRYNTIGLKERDLISLLKNGCKNKRKCKCTSVAQRGSWYCPDCYYILTRMAKHRNIYIHDLMITDRKELKEEGLILLLSGLL